MWHLQVMEPAGAQLSAAVLTLITTLIARESDPHGLLRIIKELSFARYGLEGYVIAESNRLTGRHAHGLTSFTLGSPPFQGR